MSASIATANISGPLGQALAVIDGETWLYDTDAERRRPSANDIRFFFDYGLEVRPLSPAEIAALARDSLHPILDSEARRFRALRGLLIGMDPELDEPLRERGMRRSERLLADPRVANFVVPRFLRPTDGQTWAAREAREIARRGGLIQAERLYAIVSGAVLIEVEDAIRAWAADHQPGSLAGAMAVRRAYDSGLIAVVAMGMHDGNPTGLRSLLFKADEAGWDRHLVGHLIAVAAPRRPTPPILGPEPEESELASSAAGDPAERARARIEAALQSYRPTRARESRWVPGGNRLDAVLKQVDWIARQFKTSHSGGAWNDVAALAERQLGQGRADLVAQSLTNIAKYAQAKQAAISLHNFPSHITVEVKDNGTGFKLDSVGPGSHGLAGMRHRVEAAGGRLTVASAEGRGTQISAVLPKST